MTTPRLHVVEHGSGTPLVALHGFPLDHHVVSGCLEPIFRADEPIRRIYPDLPGLGASAAGGAASTRDVLERVEAFLDETLGDAPFLLVGESYGGYLSRAVAQRRPDQVLGLALVCPSVIADAAARTLPPLTVRRPDPELVAELSPSEADEFTSIAVVQSRETLERFRTDIEPGRSAADPSAIERIRADYALDEPIERRPFTRPTVIVVGRQDSVVGYRDQWELIEHYPTATFAVLDLAGHNLQFERPELFEALMRDWLDRVADEPHG